MCVIHQSSNNVCNPSSIFSNQAMCVIHQESSQQRLRFQRVSPVHTVFFSGDMWEVGNIFYLLSLAPVLRYVGGKPKFSLLLLVPVLRYVGGEHSIFSIAIGSHLEIYVGGDTFPFVFEVSWVKLSLMILAIIFVSPTELKQWAWTIHKGWKQFGSKG